MFPSKILVIEEESVIRAALSEELKSRGHDVLLAGSGIEGLEILEKEKPDIVLTDIQTPGKRGINVLHQIKVIEPEAKVIVMTGLGSDKKAVEALRDGAIDYLKKPVDFRDLYEVVRKFASVETQEVNREFVLEESKRIVMRNQMDKVWGVVNQLLICAENVCGRAKTQELGLGLYEILINAIEHGSLEITFEEKCQAIENNTYEALLRERRADPAYSQRRVTIDYQMIPGELHYLVKDEGKGFDWRSLPCPDPSTSLLVPCGRGIFLARIYLDRVEFNEKGNEVHLVKYRNRDGGGHEP